MGHGPICFFFHGATYGMQTRHSVWIRTVIGTGSPGRTGLHSSRARSGIEARIGLAITRHRAIDRLRIAFAVALVCMNKWQRRLQLR